MKIRRVVSVLLLVLPLAEVAWSAPTTIWITPAVHDCAFATDDTVRVDVMFNSLNTPCELVGFNVDFDDSKLGFVRGERGTLTATWSAFEVNASGGLLSVSGSNGVPIPQGTSGQFARFVFVVQSCAQNVLIPVCPQSPTGDLGYAETQCGVIHVVPGNPGTLSVEPVSHTCGDASGDTVEVDVRVEDASQPIDAAGVDVAFNPQTMEYVGYRRGNLTTAWPFFDAAEVLDVIRVGGFTDTPIAGGASGVFVTLRFVVHCCDGSLNQPVCTSALVDDFSTMSTGCGAVTCVPLAARPSTWGYVKSRYR